MTVPSDASRTVDAGRLWTGGVATALVAALVALVGVLICRGLLGVPVLAPTEDGTLGAPAPFGWSGWRRWRRWSPPGCYTCCC